jgi:hypothetical protein
VGETAEFECGQERVQSKRAMKASEWKTYRTRFLVKAKQLNSSLSFVDALGRQHSGRKGDYLVESSDGVISIASRQIFEDIYVAITIDGSQSAISAGPAECSGRKLPQPCHVHPRAGLPAARPM